MASVQYIFLITFLYTEVLTWTIDLPEVRKLIIEKNERINVKEHHEENVINDVYYYYNKDGNSLHHKESEKETPHYAEKYGYQPYMEKKVNNIIDRGNMYLEKLRKSVERYTNMLQNCTASNFSVSPNSTNSTWQPRSELPDTLNITRYMTCEEVTKTSEHVRRLAELAMRTTKELQDIGYAKNYQKVDYQRENELILKLAWFLDRLAHYTGYDSNLKDLTTEKPSELSTATSSSTNMEDSVLPIPTTPELAEPISDETQELLITTDNRHFAPYLTSVKPVRRRSLDEPASTFFKYYVKTKIWNNSNTEKSNSDNLKPKFDVENEFSTKKLSKRSIVGKKYAHLLPENPVQNLGDYVKSKSATNFNKNPQEAIEIKNYFESIHHKKSLNKIMPKKYSTSNVKATENFYKIHKRSLTYIKPLISSLIQFKPTRIINKDRKPIDLKMLIDKIHQTKIVQRLLKYRSKRSTA